MAQPVPAGPLALRFFIIRCCRSIVSRRDTSCLKDGLQQRHGTRCAATRHTSFIKGALQHKTACTICCAWTSLRKVSSALYVLAPQSASKEPTHNPTSCWGLHTNTP